MPGKPPLDLHAEVSLADGTHYRWDSGANSAGDRPQGISFRTKKGDGFADASVTLSRRIDQDYVDLNLYDDFALIGYDGSVAYEGRVAANPRSIGDTHSMGVVLQGWMAHAREQKFTGGYVDRDLGSWTAAANAWKASNIAGGYAQADGGVSSDVTNGPTLELAFNTITSAGKWAVTSMYDAGPGLKVGAFYVNWVSGTNAPPVARIYSSDSDNNTGITAETSATGAAYYTLATAHRYLFAEARNDVSALTAALTYAGNLRSLAVYGNHGLTRRGSDPGGFYASDVITDIVQRFCPRLNTSGIQATTYAIPHLTFKDATAPYDAFLDINKYHLWNLAVYENKTLFFEPFDYTDYDWEVRLSDPGVTVDLQGDAVGDFANGIVVNFTDVSTGKPNRITPTDDTTLADTSSTNPANTHGLTVWTEISLSSPTTSTAAAQIGRAALAEMNQPKAPGTIRVTGHIRDRAGHWQPAWRVRAGDRIIISDHPNDRVRLVNETDYSHDSKSVSIAVDTAFMRLDAVLDRVSTALQAANLT